MARTTTITVELAALSTNAPAPSTPLARALPLLVSRWVNCCCT
jgi:hypothetical protein